MKNTIFISLLLVAFPCLGDDRVTSVNDSALRARCNELLAGLIYSNKEQSLSAIAELRDLLPELDRRGISPGDRIEVLSKILTHYGQYPSDPPERFQVIDEILTELAKTDSKTFTALSGINAAEEHRYGVLESYGFDFIESSKIAKDGSSSWGTPLINSDRVLVIAHPQYLPQLVELMEKNQLTEAMKRWNVSAMRLVLLDQRVDLIPTKEGHGNRDQVLAAAAGAVHKERQYGSTASKNESGVLNYVLRPYTQFANAKLKTIAGDKLEKTMTCSGQAECADFVLKKLGYKIDPGAPSHLYWVQKENPNLQPSEQQAHQVVKKALAMLHVLSEQNLVITPWASFPSEPRSLDTNTHINYKDAVKGPGAKSYFKPVIPKAQWDQIVQAYNIHGHPVGGSWDKVDGVNVPWEIRSGIKYLEDNGYKYDPETERWNAPAGN